MGVKQKIIPVLVGALMIGASTVAYGQAAKMSKAMSQFTAASGELVKLYSGPDPKAAVKKIAAASKRRAAAEMAIEAAMRKLNPKSEKDGKLAEKIFGDMQVQNKAVTDAQIKAAAAMAIEKSKNTKN